MKKLAQPGLRLAAVSLLFLVVAPLTAHLAFSRFGFNPTDDGFVLAYSRRILTGQIPHLDFISIRPAGSALLHSPFVLFGGDYTFWISRLFVWFQLAAIAWAWTAIINRMFELRLSLPFRFLLGLLAFMFTAHTFPVMAWHTIDGLFLFSLGLLLCLQHRQSVRLTGYFLVGAACLCKQNFLLLAPLTLILLKDWRQWRYWLAAAAPASAYALVILLAGAMPDLMVQLGAQTDFLTAGVKSYLTFDSGLYFLIGALAAYLLYGNLAGRAPVFFGSVIIVFAVAGFATGLYPFSWQVYLPGGFSLFALASGIAAVLLVRERSLNDRTRAGILVLAMAWSASVSIGYQTPSLAAGPMALLLAGYLLSVPPIKGRTVAASVKGAVILAAMILLIVLLWGAARREIIYRDRSAPELTYTLDSVFPGTAKLLTNQNTHDFLADLRVAVSMAGGGQYAILPDMPGYWVQAGQPNPLSVDWTLFIEISRPELVARVNDELDARRGSMVVIMQKYRADIMRSTFAPVPEDYSEAYDHVLKNYQKVGETRFFEIYE